MRNFCLKLDDNVSNYTSVINVIAGKGSSVVLETIRIENSFSDGIMISRGKYNDVNIKNCRIERNGRNGITDNAYNSKVENCEISYNGVRTVPRSG